MFSARTAKPWRRDPPRHIVNRKVWGGNRTEAGAKAQSVLMSVLRTAAQRGVDALDFLSRTLRACVARQPQLLCDTG